MTLEPKRLGSVRVRQWNDALQKKISVIVATLSAGYSDGSPCFDYIAAFEANTE